MRIVTLEYHDVVPGDDFDASGFPGPDAASYKMAAGDFAAHLAAVGAVYRGPRATVDTLIADGATHGHGQAPVVFTFDDGGRSALEPSADILEAHGWRGHFFMATDYIGRRGFLGPAELRALAARGHMIGSHSCSHPLRMSACPVAQLRREWHDSVARLADILGAPVHLASVPGGGYRRHVAAAAADAGVRVLFTSEPVVRVAQVQGCHVLGRFTLRRDSAPQLAADFATGAGGARFVQWASWNARKAAKAAAGPAYLWVRARVYGAAGSGRAVAPRDS